MSIKILWLYQYATNYNFDHWFHMDFVQAIKNTGIDIRAYGPNIHVCYPHLALAPYDRNLTLQGIQECLGFDFDLIILNTKSRMFEYYNPHAVVATGPIIPTDIRECKKPKIVLEEDYHYEKNDDWYVKDIKSSLVIQRHLNNYVIQKSRGNVKTAWLPFSVDTNIFKPDPNICRKNTICFSGHKNASTYPFRTKACQMLSRAGHFVDYDSTQKEQNYLKCLQSYVAHLNGSSKYYVTTAKMFEIMSSGSLLLTNRSDKYGLVELFTPGSYLTYNEDCSDLEYQAYRITHDECFRKEVTAKGLQCIKDRHTNTIRIQELLTILEKEL